MTLAPVVEVLEAGRREGIAPALTAVVRAGGETVHASCHGAVPAPSPRPLRPEDRFDVASLTKVMATTTLAAQLVAEGTLALDAPAARWLPGFEAAAKERVTVRQLLAHASGLPSYRPYHAAVAADPEGGRLFRPPEERPVGAALEEAAARGLALVRAAVLAEPLEAPPGTRARYGDPAFLALGWIVEAAAGGRLDALFEARVARPLGLARTGYRRAGAAAPAPAEWSFPPTERCPHRHEVNQGDVNDDNAWAIGAVAGHAGLFSTAADVAGLGAAWLDAARGRASIVPAAVAGEFLRRDPTPGSERALGWDTPSAGASALGTRLGRGPRGAVGHLGYTGCSLWIDLDREVVCALLTNHCHPAGTDKPRIRAFRARFHDAVAEALGIG